MKDSIVNLPENTNGNSLIKSIRHFTKIERPDHEKAAQGFISSGELAELINVRHDNLMTGWGRVADAVELPTYWHQTGSRGRPHTRLLMTEQQAIQMVMLLGSHWVRAWLTAELMLQD